MKQKCVKCGTDLSGYLAPRFCPGCGNRLEPEPKQDADEILSHFIGPTLPPKPKVKRGNPGKKST